MDTCTYLYFYLYFYLYLISVCVLGAGVPTGSGSCLTHEQTYVIMLSDLEIELSENFQRTFRARPPTLPTLYYIHTCTDTGTQAGILHACVHVHYFDLRHLDISISSKHK